MKEKPLLTDGKSNTKTAKNSLRTYYLSLQPTDLNSKKENLCKFSTKECREMCLQFAGRQSFDNVVKSRTRKTELLVNSPAEFVGRLWKELEDLNNKGERCAVRLNLLSDVNWDVQFVLHLQKDMSQLKNIQFYDYTKDHMKLAMNVPRNYNLTYSYSGSNWKWCENFLINKKANVAVVFKDEIPKTWKGYPVINGDLSDERFLDPKGVIVGLKYKTPKGVKYTKNKFVIDEKV